MRQFNIKKYVVAGTAALVLSVSGVAAGVASSSVQATCCVDGDSVTIVPGQTFDTGPMGTFQITSENERMYAIFQDDRNLVLYNQLGSVLWASNTAGAYGGWLAMQNDSNLVIYNSAGGVAWQTNTGGNEFGHGLNRLKVQNDGNLVLYHIDEAGAGHVLWSRW